MVVAGFVVFFIDHLVPSEGSHGVQSGAMVTLRNIPSTEFLVATKSTFVGERIHG